MALVSIPSTLGITEFTIGNFSPSQRKYERPYVADEYISEPGETRFAGTVGFSAKVGELPQSDRDLTNFNLLLDKYRNQVRIPLPAKYRPTNPHPSGVSFSLVPRANPFSPVSETVGIRLNNTGSANADLPVGSFINVGTELYTITRARPQNGMRITPGQQARLNLYPPRQPLTLAHRRGFQTVYNFPSGTPGTVLGGMTLYNGELLVALTHPTTFVTTLYAGTPTTGTGWSFRTLYSGPFFGSGLIVWQAPGRDRKEVYGVQGGGTTTITRLDLSSSVPSENSQQIVGRYASASGSNSAFVDGAVAWQAPGDSVERLYFIKQDKLYRVDDIITDGILVDQGQTGTAKGVAHVATFPGVFAQGLTASSSSLYIAQGGGASVIVYKYDASRGLSNATFTTLITDLGWGGTNVIAVEIWNGIILCLANFSGQFRIGRINLTPTSASDIEFNNPFVMARLYADRKAGFQGPTTSSVVYDWREIAAVIPPVNLYLPRIGYET